MVKHGNKISLICASYCWITVICIVSGITSFTDKWKLKKPIFTGWFGFSSRSQGVPHSLLTDRIRVISSERSLLKQQIFCYFIGIHSFVNVKWMQTWQKKLLEDALTKFQSSHGLQRKLIGVFRLFFHGFSAWQTPLCFLSRILRQRRSLKGLKKDIQKFCLFSWIVIINIYNYNLPLRVYYCI